jgi:hypothetical protein
VQKSAAHFVLQYSLQDESFFRQMQDDGVLEVIDIGSPPLTPTSRGDCS